MWISNLRHRLSGVIRLVSFAGLLLVTIGAHADIPVPALTGPVIDQTQTLSAADAAALDQKLRAFHDKKGSQIQVLIVPTTQPEAIEQFSIRVAEAWKIGRKGVDDGVLITVAKQDRKIRIEVGYGLEGALPDVIANRIIKQVITPRFKQGDFAGGISEGVDRIIAVVEGEPLPVPAATASDTPSSGAILAVLVGLAVVVTLIWFACSSMTSSNSSSYNRHFDSDAIEALRRSSTSSSSSSASSSSSRARRRKASRSSGSYVPTYDDSSRRHSSSSSSSRSSGDSSSWSGGGGSFGGGGSSGDW